MVTGYDDDELEKGALLAREWGECLQIHHRPASAR